MIKHPRSDPYKSCREQQVKIKEKEPDKKWTNSPIIATSRTLKDQKKRRRNQNEIKNLLLIFAPNLVQV